MNGHSGSENVFFPWCHRAAHAPDYAGLNSLAGNYSSSSKYPSLVYKQSNADYATTGELDDCSYGINGTMAMVLEISTNKQPSETEMIKYYNYNIPAMTMLLTYAGYGAAGTVTDSITGKPVAAAIFVDGLYPSYTDPQLGDYHKFLLPSTYTFNIVANGYQPKTVQHIVVADKSSTITDIQLQPLKGQYAYKVVSAVIPGNNPADEGNTPAVIGPPDQKYYSIGKGGTVILDLQHPLADLQGKDLKIVEGDNTAEGFTCYAAQTMDGPWKLLGTGKGTSDFDLGITGLQNGQFIKIVDDNDGTANVNDAGFDLDAVEVFLSSVTGITETNATAGLSLYPNPFTNFLNLEIKGESAGTVCIQVYNTLGEKIASFTKRINKGDAPFLQLDTSDLKPGIYFYSLDFEGNDKTWNASRYLLKL